MKRKSKRVGAHSSHAVLEAATDAAIAQRKRLQQSRNKANTLRNSVKVEHYLMEVEKMHGFAKSWALRERLEQGEVSLDDVMRR